MANSITKCEQLNCNWLLGECCLLPEEKKGECEVKKLQHWQIKQKSRELGRKIIGDDSDYEEEIMRELEDAWVNYLGVGDYLEQRMQGIDLTIKGCPYCKKSPNTLEIAHLYDNLTKQNKRQAYRMLQLLMDERE